MPARTRTSKVTLPQFGPAARRAREAALDVAATRSRAARAGTPAPSPDATAELAAAQERIAALQAELTKAQAAEERARASAARSLAALVEAQAARAEAERRLAERISADDGERRAAGEREAREAGQRALAERTRSPVSPAPAASRMPEVSRDGSARHRECPATGPGGARRQPRPSASPEPARPAPVAAAEPPPPPVPARHGRLDPTSPHAGLLGMAPPRPGDRAGQFFAELLDREAIKAAPTIAGESDDGGPRCNPARDDLRALACLWREATHFYVALGVPESDGLPLSGERMRRATIGAGGGSIAGQVAEG